MINLKGFAIKTKLHLFFLLVSVALPAMANPILEGYRTQANQENAGFKDFSIAAGQKLYTTKGADLSCASCHTDSPKATGKHIKTNKEIAPMAANPKRFTDAAQVEKWFKRNCNDVLGRACSTQEKGDFILYVLSVK